MYRIGLTGGIATGKSTVANMLTELGARVIDADQIAREVVQPGEVAYRELVSLFGSNILLPDGQIDRHRLGQLVWRDRCARQKLNDITHPHILQRMEQLALLFEHQGYQMPLILDIPLLIESNLQHMVDEIWVVTAEPEVQIGRLMARNQLSRQEALARITAQLPLREKERWATEIINNSHSLDSTRIQVMQSLARAVGRAKLT